MTQQPIPELEILRGQEWSFRNLVVNPDSKSLLDGLTGDALEIVATFWRGDARRFGLKLRVSTDGERNVPVWFDSRTGEFGIADVHTGSDLGPEAPVRMHVFVDRSVIEVYLNGNVITKVAYVGPVARGIDAFAEGGTYVLDDIKVWEMNAMWPTTRPV